MSEKKVIISVSGGVVDVEYLPEGVEVEIREYDLDNFEIEMDENDSMIDDRIETDENGIDFICREFSH